MAPFVQSIGHHPARPSDRDPKTSTGNGTKQGGAADGPNSGGLLFAPSLFSAQQVPSAVTPSKAPLPKYPESLGARFRKMKMTWPSPSQICAF